MLRFCLACLVAVVTLANASANPFDTHGPLRVAASGTYLEHTDGTPFLFLADTCWTGPALSTEADWAEYLADRKQKGFTAIQFNMVSPWRTAPTDAEGNTSYTITDGQLALNQAFYERLDQRFDQIQQAGLLPVPVLVWAHKKGDAGAELPDEQILTLLRLQLARYRARPALWVLAGDNRYNPEETTRWKQMGRAVASDFPGLLMTTHPTGQNFPWGDWANEDWLSVLGYQSGHGDNENALKWVTTGPPAKYAQSGAVTKPIINLEPPYEAHHGYTTKKPHSALSVRRCLYWSLLVHPPAGVTYGGHGVWSWHTRPGEEPTDHPGTGPAKSWRDALNLPAAAQVSILRTTFERLPWQTLRPAPRLLRSQPGDANAAKFTAIAATPDNQAFLLYTPAGVAGLAALDPAVLTGKALVILDPASGKSVEANADTMLEKAKTVLGPDGDLVLLGEANR